MFIQFKNISTRHSDGSSVFAANHGIQKSTVCNWILRYAQNDKVLAVIFAFFCTPAFAELTNNGAVASEYRWLTF